MIPPRPEGIHFAENKANGHTRGTLPWRKGLRTAYSSGRSGTGRPHSFRSAAMKRQTAMCSSFPLALTRRGSPKEKHTGRAALILPKSLIIAPRPQASVRRARGMSGTWAFLASFTPMLLNWTGSRVALRVLWGKTMMEMPLRSRSTHPPGRRPGLYADCRASPQ